MNDGEVFSAGFAVNCLFGYCFISGRWSFLADVMVELLICMLVLSLFLFGLLLHVVVNICYMSEE